nr:hypothetical protein [Psychrobacter sp. 4Bb]
MNGFKTAVVFVSQLFVRLFTLRIFRPKCFVIESYTAQKLPLARETLVLLFA